MDQKVAEHIIAHSSPNVLEFAQVNVTAAGKVGGKKDEQADTIADEVIQKHHDLDKTWVQLLAARDKIAIQTNFHDGVLKEKVTVKNNNNIYVVDCDRNSAESGASVDEDTSDFTFAVQDFNTTQVQNSAANIEMLTAASEYFRMWINRDDDCPGSKAEFIQNVSVGEAYEHAYLLNVAENAEFCKQAPSGMSFLATSTAIVPSETPHFKKELQACHKADVCHLQVPLYWSLMCGERFTHDEVFPELVRQTTGALEVKEHAKRQLVKDITIKQERIDYCVKKHNDKEESKVAYDAAVDAQAAELKQLNDEYEAAKTAYTEAFDGLCSLIKLRKVMLMGLDKDPAELKDCDLPEFRRVECEELLNDNYCSDQCGKQNSPLCTGLTYWSYDISIPTADSEPDPAGSLKCFSFKSVYESNLISSQCSKLCAVDCLEYDTTQNPGFPLLPQTPTAEQCEENLDVEVEYFTPPQREPRHNGAACTIPRYSTVKEQSWLYETHHLQAMYPMGSCPEVIDCSPQFRVDGSFCSRGCARKGESSQILKVENAAGCDDEAVDCTNLADCPVGSLYCTEQRSVVMMLDKSQLFLEKGGDVESSLRNVAQLTRSILGRLLYRLPNFNYTVLNQQLDTNMFEFKATALMDVKIATYGLFPPRTDTDDIKVKYTTTETNTKSVMSDLEDYCLDKSLTGFLPEADTLKESIYLDVLHNYETVVDTPGLNNAHEIHTYMETSQYFTPDTKHKNTLLIIGGGMVLGEKYMRDHSSGSYITYVIGIKTDENKVWSSNIVAEPAEPKSTFVEVKSFAGAADQIDELIHMFCMRVTASTPTLFLMSENVVFHEPSQEVGMSTEDMSLEFKLLTQCIQGSNDQKTVTRDDGSLWHYLDSRIRKTGDLMSEGATYTVAMERYNYMNQYDAFNLWSGKISTECSYKLFLHFESVQRQESILLPYIYMSESSGVSESSPDIVENFFSLSTLGDSLADFQLRDDTVFEEPDAGGPWKVSLIGHK